MDKNRAYILSQQYLESLISDFTYEDIDLFQRLIAYHSELYYELESPIISDAEYDTLFKKLQELEGIFWVKNKQTIQVWSALKQSTFAKVKHSRPMISLDNTYNSQELRDFDARVKRILARENVILNDLNYALEYKFDGLWIELIYENWKLIQAITRWDGVEGEDITENIKTIENIPKLISYRERLEVRGEVIMPISSFEWLNEKLKNEWKKVFANPRNAASWSVRLKDNSITSERKLIFFAYDIWELESAEKVIRHSDETTNEFDYTWTIQALKSLWFHVTDYLPLLKDIDSVITEIENFWDTKKTLDYEIDGLVVKLNDMSLWSKIGFTAHHPRYAISYKFPAEITTSTLLSVEHQVWRTGTLTPVANLEPINLWGVTVRRATLHNYDEIEKLDVKVGDKVFLKRAWEVIPKIISVAVSCSETGLLWDRSQGIILPPTHCPSCGSEIQKDEDAVRYYCPNTHKCPEQVRQKLIYAVGKQGLNIDGLWSAQVELFYGFRWLLTLADIYRLESRYDEILALPWYKEKSVSNLLKSIEKSKKQPLWRFIVALSIPWVGRQAAKELAKIFHSNDDFLIFPYSKEELESLQDIGIKTAETIYEFFHHPLERERLQDVLQYIEIEFTPSLTSLSMGEKESQALWWKYSWKKMCITGSFDAYSRDDLIEKLEALWGEFVSSVSKKTDYLLSWEKAGSKLKKAQELWIEVLSLEDFFK